jgi:hypothetical protein
MMKRLKISTEILSNMPIRERAQAEHLRAAGYEHASLGTVS